MHVISLVSLVICQWSVLCAGGRVNITDVNRLKRATWCQHATDDCKPGTYVKELCSEAPQKVVCSDCGPGTYMDHFNHELECQQCRMCDSGEIESQCSLTNNTKCKCKVGEYCASAECTICNLCDTCDEFGIEVACTRTNNSVCKTSEVSSKNNRFWWIALIILAVLLVGLGICIYRWYHNKSQTGTGPSGAEAELQPILVDPPTDIDLDPHLYMIADKVGLPDIKQLVTQSGISRPKMDTLILNDPDTREQCVILLREWYQIQGLHNAFPKLIQNLRQMKRNATADELLREIERYMQNLNGV
ncbi:tumor necrosis factor receptor superfamily member 6 isoform X2 [Amia ocellicauda]|uniref:tumor necrosis factor receptor superfamily member 6 isoform X2 n=1 Tax=Amia ocellicauda TaxID=2972642 RepID=UPI0034644D53